VEKSTDRNQWPGWTRRRKRVKKAISPEQHSAPMKLPAIPPHLPDGVEMFDGVDFGGAARFECII